MFDSARGRAAANARWQRYRERRAELEREAKERTVAALVEAAEHAAETMAALLDSPNERARFVAARDILDRLLGKMLEHQEHAGEERAAVAQHVVEADAEWRALAEAIAQLGEAGDKRNAIDDALRAIAFDPQTSIGEKMSAFRLLSDRQDRRARRQLQESAIDLRARGF